jgi:hypothetical protein
MSKAKSKLDFLSALSPGMTAIFNPNSVLEHARNKQYSFYADFSIVDAEFEDALNGKKIDIDTRIFKDSSNLIRRATLKAAGQLAELSRIEHATK